MSHETLYPGESFTNENALAHIPKIYKRGTSLFDENAGTLNIGSKETDEAAEFSTN